MRKTNKNNKDAEDANNTDNEFAGAQFTDITEVERSPNSEDGMPEDKIKSLANKFITLKKDALLEVAKDYPKKKSLLVDYSELFKFNAQVCDELIDFPDKVIRIFEEVANEQNIPINFAGEVKFHVRFILPKGFTVKIRDVTSEYINKFFCVDGVITKVSDVLPKVYVGVFQCPLCGKRKDVYQEKNRNLLVPSVCDDCKKVVRFKLLPEESKFVDIQRLEVQEPLEMLRGGEEAQKIEIWLTDDLTGKVLPGNTIEVAGVMKLIPPKDINDAVYRKFIDANNINVIDREFTEVDLSEDDIKKINEFAKSPNIAEKFVSSISPTIYGYKEIKEAMALQLFGGSKFELPDKTKTRGEMHLLLIGDPGVAKSKLLIGASNIAPKSIYVSGKGTSAAGLTATAEKDEFAEGAWVLKAGALVLASGGIACVDEFDKMEKEDRAAMHEALEQQSYHPDTEIMFSNGEKIKIGKFVDELMNSKKDSIAKGKDCEILVIPEEMQFMILTTDFKSIYSVPIDRVSRHKAPNYFIRITYTNGRSIIVTPEHPVYVFKDGEIKETPAESVKKGMLSPTPSKYFIKNKEISLFKVKISKKSKQVVLPDKINKELCRLLGYLITDGHIYYSIKNRDAEIMISNTDKEIVDDCCDLFKNIFGVSLSLQKQESCSRKKVIRTLYTARCISIPIYKFFMSNFSEIAKKVDKKRVPGCIFHTSEENKVQFLLGAFRGDGFYDSERTGYVTTSADLARDYTDLLLSLGIYSYITPYSIYFSNKEKRMKSAYKVVISGSESIEYFYELVGKYDKRKDKIDYFVQRSKNKLNDHDRIPVEVVARLKKLLKEYRLDDGYFCQSIKTNGAVHRKIVLKYIEKLELYILSLSNVSDRYDPRKIRKKYGIPIAEIVSKIKKSVSVVAYLERNPSTKNYTFLFETVKQMAQEKIKNTKISISVLKDFVASDIRFVEVKNVEILQNDNIKWVYDVTVEPNHTFISEGLVLHNTISIAKAGIVAKFRAETCVLAAANPKFGRFSSEKAITDQFDIPPALLSRFDLIFPLRDIMDNTQDQGVANYVLKAYSGKKEELLIPPLDIEFIRKYIAYARKNLNPVVGENAQKQIEEYYLRLRRESSKDVVQITARQLEGIIRLSCASAKMRLKNVVEKEDVDRAIRLIEYSLNLVARDKETGKIDVDRVTQGPREKRDKVKSLSEILEYLTENGKKHCLIEDFVKQAKEQGIDEKDAKNFIENAKREGKIFEPKDGEIGMIE